jgi:hypothetical protein
MNRTKMLSALLVAAALLPALHYGRCEAAVGCTLNDPDRDILRIFPNATNYTTEFIAISERGGEALARDLEAAIGDSLDPVYESLGIPYAYYTVLAGRDTIGRVHGVNQKGEFGGMQIILATDPDGVIIEMYYQRLSSPHAKLLRGESFTDRFVGLDLRDFCLFAEAGEGPVAAVGDPTGGATADVAATLRGVAKNLYLLNAFHLEGTCDEASKGDDHEAQDAR